MTGQADVLIERDVTTVMRDGIVLRCDVYSPVADGSFPVLVQRTPYDKSLYTALGEYYARAGYVYVLQDVRGQFASDGVWDPWVNEADDGFDTIAWAARLPGSNGDVGAVGTSYQAAAAWQTAILRPPALKAMACAVTPADYYDQWIYPGGAFSLSFNTTWLLRNVASSAASRLEAGADIAARMSAAYEQMEQWYTHLPLREFPPLLPDDRRVAPYFFDWINAHPKRDEFWERISLRGRHKEVDVPVLNVAGWYDVFTAGGIENFQSLRDAGGVSRLVVGPWAHNDWGTGLGDVEFGPHSKRSFPGLAVEWFDRWLKGERVVSDTEVTYFSMGDCTWRESSQWPPVATKIVAYELGARGVLGSTGGPSDTFVYDPADPVPSVGGQGCCYAPQSPFGPYDQRIVESRSDVLVYTTEPLDEPLEVAGPVSVELYIESSAPSTDFTAKLVDVHADGAAINLCEGIIRVDDLVAGRTARVVIDAGATAHVFARSHRVRLEISSSNFPMYDRNLNTGERFGASSKMVVAHQTVHHDDARPSALHLPVQTVATTA